LHVTDGDGISRNILIDGGQSATYKYGGLKDYIQNEIYTKKQIIDFLIITHTDNDHVNGIIKFFKDDSMEKRIGKVWYNYSDKNPKYINKNTSHEMSIESGLPLRDYLAELKLWEGKLYYFNPKDSDLYKKEIFPNIAISLISPDRDALNTFLTKSEEQASIHKMANEFPYTILRENRTFEDYSLIEKSPEARMENKSSMAFIIEAEKQTLLFLGDANITIINNSLDALGFNKSNKLDCGLIKLSHHGSIGNINNQFFEYVNGKSFLVSTNGNKHEHPDEVTICKCVFYNPDSKIFLNYKAPFSKLKLIPEIEANVYFLDTGILDWGNKE
jgi:beta-lactamase superfamily II metal-dependent hydrolase